LAPGALVEREPYDLLFGERRAPDGTPLGRPPTGSKKSADLYASLLAAEPHASPERKRELRAQAARAGRRSPLFFDLTLSLSKSISIFHASLGENARLAHEAGDADGERYWSDLIAETDQMIMQAVHAGFGYFQREAGYTRTGSHHARPGTRKLASGTKPTWRSRTGCSTPPATVTCSCTSTPRSPTSPAPPQTASGVPPIRSATPSTSARSPRSPPSTWKKH
jgi:hypothetical protein